MLKRIKEYWQGLQYKNGLVQERTWTELELEKVRRNYREIKKRIPKKSKVMVVINSEYGGNANNIMAKELNRLGVESFVVDTVEEGVKLRKHRIRGEIVVFDETKEERFSNLMKYQLTQVVRDEEYGTLLSSYIKEKTKNKKQMNVQIQLSVNKSYRVDTNAEIHRLEKLYQFPGLVITGTFACFSEESSQELEDLYVRELEAEEFERKLTMLKERNINIGKTHLHTMGEELVPSQTTEDYIRVGTILYGMENSKSFEPVISVKAKILQVKELNAGDLFLYGRCYMAPKSMKVAVVSIGSAEGISKKAMENENYIVVNGDKVPIVGEVCINQVLVDVTQLNQVEEQDVVTVKGTTS